MSGKTNTLKVEKKQGGGAGRMSLLSLFFFKVVYTKQIVTKQNLSIQAEDPNSKGEGGTKGVGGWVTGSGGRGRD